MQFFLVLVLGALIPAIAQRACIPSQRERMIWVLVGSYVFRLLFGAFIGRNVAFFSHGAGGDWVTYQGYAELIARFWDVSGFDFVTSEAYPDVVPGMAGTALVCNLFAAVMYLCGPPSVIGCTAVVAFLACMLCLVLYRFALDLGSTPKAAFRLFLLTILGPSFIFHTSDMYKDGVNAFLAVGVIYLCVRLSKRFSILELIAVVAMGWALYHVRPYMVYMCMVPLPIGLLGNKLSARTAVAAFILAFAGVIIATSQVTENVVAEMEQTFETGGSDTSREYNANSGSGVRFDDGGNKWRALGPKLLYTVFSPFPWMSGSVGLQLGKLDTLIWYYLLFSALAGLPELWKRDRATVLMLLAFVIPATIAYATTMANVGLILRQRMPIMMITSLLAASRWSALERRAQRPSAVASNAESNRRPSAEKIVPT